MAKILFIISFVCYCNSIYATENQYLVKIDAENKRVANVSVFLEAQNHKLFLNKNAKDTGLYNGWATFVHKIQATTESGQVVAIKYIGDGVWSIPKEVNSPIKLKYQLLLQHDRFPNTPGDDELAYAQDWGVMWTGRALFITGQQAEGIQVEFELSPDWNSTTPWKKIKQHTYVVPNTKELLDSAFMLGKHVAKELSFDTAKVSIGLGGNGMASQSDFITSIVTEYMNHYGTLFGEYPEQKIALLAANGRLDGGGVMGTSISMLFSGELNAEKIQLLHYITTHEIYHLWNANLNLSEANSMSWLLEGFAEYMTFRAALELGYIDSHFFLAQIADRYHKYQNVAGGISLADAGKNKFENYDLIYSGGMMMALTLDSVIRNKSDQHHSLDSIHKDLYSEFKSTSGGELTNQQLASFVLNKTKVNVDDLFENHVTGKKPIPLKEVLNAVGLSLLYDETNINSTIKPMPNITEQQKNFLDSWLKR